MTGIKDIENGLNDYYAALRTGEVKHPHLGFKDITYKGAYAKERDFMLNFFEKTLGLGVTEIIRAAVNDASAAAFAAGVRASGGTLRHDPQVQVER